MAAGREIIGVRYKIQTRDRFGEWSDFGPFFFNKEEGARDYFKDIYPKGRAARLVKVTEEVQEYMRGPE